MGDIYMTKETGAKIMKLLIAGMVAFLFLIAYVLYQSYAGRADLVAAERAECEGAKRAQLESSQAWHRQGEYTLATTLKKRSKRDCATAFPKAGFLP